MKRELSTKVFLGRRGVLQGLGAAAGLVALGPVMPKAHAVEVVRIAAVYSQPVEQQWVSRLHKAASEAAARGEVEYAVAESVSNTDFERVMREFCENGHTLIIGDVFGVEDAVRSVAADYPETRFLLGSSFKPDGQLSNLATFDSYIHDASYLSGMVAGAMSKSGVVGIVGGYPIPTVNRQINAYIAGAKSLVPDAKVMVSFMGSWFDPPKAKEMAFAQIDGGADVLFAERFGVSDAAKDRGIFAIGNIIDTQPEYPETVITSILWHFEPTLDKAVAHLKADTFVAADYGVYSFMKEGGCSIAPFGTFEDKVSDEIKALIAEKEAAIRNGSFTVEINDEEPRSS